MFVRRKKNRSGSTSVVVADKSSGRFTELHVIGVVMQSFRSVPFNSYVGFSLIVSLLIWLYNLSFFVRSHPEKENASRSIAKGNCLLYSIFFVLLHRSPGRSSPSFQLLVMNPGFFMSCRRRYYNSHRIPAFPLSFLFPVCQRTCKLRTMSVKLA